MGVANYSNECDILLYGNKLPTVIKIIDAEWKVLKAISQTTVFGSKTHKLLELRKFHTPFSCFLQELSSPLSNVELTNINFPAQTDRSFPSSILHA